MHLRARSEQLLLLFLQLALTHVSLILITTNAHSRLSWQHFAEDMEELN